jgi:hypothetical protein
MVDEIMYFTRMTKKILAILLFALAMLSCSLGGSGTETSNRCVSCGNNTETSNRFAFIYAKLEITDPNAQFASIELTESEVYIVVEKEDKSKFYTGKYTVLEDSTFHLIDFGILKINLSPDRTSAVIQYKLFDGYHSEEIDSSFDTNAHEFNVDIKW